MMIPQPVARILVIATMASATSYADLLVYEPFDYPSESPIPGADGGSGFLGEWVENTTGFETVTGSGSLSYPLLETIGNSAKSLTNGSTPQNTGGAAIIRDIASPYPGAAQGGVTWVSFLFQLESAPGGFNTQSDWMAVTLRAYPSGNNALRFGTYYQGGSQFFGIGKPGDDPPLPEALSSTVLSIGEVYFFVLSIEWNTTDDFETVSLYINPDLSQPLSSPDAVSNDIRFANASGSTNRNELRYAEFDVGVNEDTGAVWYWDEIRIGTSFADIAPGVIPEPSVFGLGLLGIGFLWCMRRRRI